MKLAAFTLIGLSIAAAAHAQVQTNPAPQPFLPVPEFMPEITLDTGLDPNDASVLSKTIRGSLQDLPSGTLVQEQTGTEAPVTTPAAVATSSPGAAGVAEVGSVGEPTPLAPEATPVAIVSPEEPAEEAAEPAGKDIINVIVEGVKSGNGTVNVAVCDTALSEAGCPYHTEIKAAAGFVEATFEGIPPGRYAVVGYHDVNGNSEHDKNFLGVPKEPYALSSKAGAKMIPTFKDAAISIKEGENTVIITMRRFGS